MIKKYQTVVGSTLGALDENVNSAIENGYQPYGNLVIFEDVIVQPMVLVSESWGVKVSDDGETILDNG